MNPEGLTALNKAGPDSEIIKTLLIYGADVNARIKGVLMSAVEVGDLRPLQFYQENGADCNVPDSSADSMYHRPYPVPKISPIDVAAFPKFNQNSDRYVGGDGQVVA